MKINSFQQAKARLEQLTEGLKEVGEFLDRADNVMTAMDALKGTGEAPSLPSTPRPTNGAPDSMTERVFHVFRAASKPLSPVQALELYTQTGWPRPEDRRELYTKIIGSINYLTKRKEVLVKTPEGLYRVK